MLSIAFDADDTLWHTEPYYRGTEEQYTALLSPYQIDPRAALSALHRLEIANLPYFGYGIRCFTLSMIEAAVEVTDGQVRGADINAIVNLGRAMTGHEIRLLEGVEETLARLSQSYPLMLITKGDALDQEGKLARSGLAQYFRSVEVVSDKTPEIYAGLLARHGLDAASFLMVGNSPRSDIIPVLSLGGYAVYVPYEHSWAHEAEGELPEDRSRYFEINGLVELPALVEQIEAASNTETFR